MVLLAVYCRPHRIESGPHTSMPWRRQEWHDTVTAAFEEGLVDGWFISPGHVERALKRSKESVLEDLCKGRHTYIENVVDEMEWWACFKQPKRSRRGTMPAAHATLRPEPAQHSQAHRAAKVTPDAPCPCGSGKKYKNAVGRSHSAAQRGHQVDERLQRRVSTCPFTRSQALSAQ